MEVDGNPGNATPNCLHKTEKQANKKNSCIQEIQILLALNINIHQWNIPQTFLDSLRRILQSFCPLVTSLSKSYEKEKPNDKILKYFNFNLKIEMPFPKTSL